MNRRVFETMGTVASLVGIDESAAAQVAEVFAAADARFSLYRPDSELSRVASGALTMMDSSEQLRDAYADALTWRALTGGAFTPNRPDGVIDLNGIVKAQAMRDSGELLRAAGFLDWSLSVGGDILVSGSGTHLTGIVDPSDRAHLLCSITLGTPRVAMATSGSAERGDHIWRAGSNGPPEFVQVTVAAHDIVSADVLATAIVAGGRITLDHITERFDVDVITVDRDGELLATPGMTAALAA